jgi:peptide/nickel transport system substrate-binding protein
VELWKYAAKANAYNLSGHIPPGAYGHNPDLTLYSYDSEKAKSLLAEAGYSEGFGLKIVAHEGWSVPTKAIGKMFERIGIKTEMEFVTIANFWSRAYIPTMNKSPEEQDWDLLLGVTWDWTGHTGIAFFTFGLLEEFGARWIEYDDTFEAMWDQMARTLYGPAQEEKIRRMEQYVYENAYGLFLYTPLTLYAVNKEVNFVPQTNMHLSLKETSVTKNHWSVRGRNN